MASFNHGAYSSEKSTSLVSPITASAGLQVYIGTAPVHLASDPYATVGKPIVCYDFASCEQQLGYSENFKEFTLCEAMDFNFRVFNNAPVIFINVLDPSNTSHTKKNAEESIQVSADGVAVYSKKYVLLDTLTVKSGSKTLERWTDYVAEFSDGGALSTKITTEAKAETISEYIGYHGVMSGAYLGTMNRLHSKTVPQRSVKKMQSIQNPFRQSFYPKGIAGHLD